MGMERWNGELIIPSAHSYVWIKFAPNSFFIKPDISNPDINSSLDAW